MDPRTAARAWFLDKPGSNRYDIEVHVQQSFWHNGFGGAFFRCTNVDPPYHCTGFWRGQEVELEWVPRQWLSLSMQTYDETMAEGIARILRLEATLRYTMAVSSNGQDAEEAEPTGAARYVVEWRVRDGEQRKRELEEQTGVGDVQAL
jgi:hypothetical protein